MNTVIAQGAPNSLIRHIQDHPQDLILPLNFLYHLIDNKGHMLRYEYQPLIYLLEKELKNFPRLEVNAFEALQSKQ